MAAVTTPPQVFNSGCCMLLKTGTLLTWHCLGEVRSQEGKVTPPQRTGVYSGNRGCRDMGQALGIILSFFLGPPPHPACNMGSITGWG